LLKASKRFNHLLFRAMLCSCCAGPFLTSGRELDPPSAASAPKPELPERGILREFWLNIDGGTVRSLTTNSAYPLNPSGKDTRSDFEAPLDWGEHHGQRMRALLSPPVSGNYIFWIASDDCGELWLSTDDNPANKRRIARMLYFVASRDWTRFYEQQSDSITLESGKAYYIEAVQKQGIGWDNLSVAWQIPGRKRELITGQCLTPWNSGLGGEGITHEIWTNLAGASPSDSTNNGAPARPADHIEQLAWFEASTSGATNLSQRVSGYVHAPADGPYVFWVASDMDSELWLSTDDTPANKRRIASVSGHTGPREWLQRPEQRSPPITLAGGKSYYIEALEAKAASDNHLAVGWQLPEGTLERPISAKRLTPYDSDYDGMPDWYEVRHNLDPHDPDDARAHPVWNGLNNLEEFRRGNDPQFAEALRDLPPILSVGQIRRAGYFSPGERVRLKAVVTYSFKSLDFYVQDGTGGIFVTGNGQLKKSLSAGDVVQLEGVVSGTAPAPKVVLKKAAVLGQEPLPPIETVSFDLGWAGFADLPEQVNNKRVAIDGIVRSAGIQEDAVNGKNLVLKVVTGGGEYEVRCPEIGNREVKAWIGATLQVRGVAGINPQQSSRGFIIYVPRQTDIHIQVEPSEDPFGAPSRTVRSLLPFYRQDIVQRVRVEGTVLYSEPGRMLFLRDETGALQVFTSQPGTARPGDVIQVIGFPASGDYSPVLTDAIFRKTGPHSNVTGTRSEPEEILAGKLNCDLVTLKGRLVEHIYAPDKQGFWFKAGSILLDAYWSATNGLPSAFRFEKDSLLEITGLALVQVSRQAGKPQTFHALLPSVDAVTVLSRPPWWTLRHTLRVVGAMAAVILTGLVWITVLRRKVEERSRQLTDEMRRHEHTKHQHAMEGERARIARDLHDDLGASLTQLRLLSALESRGSQLPEPVRNRIGQISEKSREMVASLDEIVWAVNPANDTLSGLATYLCHFAEEFFHPTSIRCRLDVADCLPQAILTSEVRHNMYLAVREALNNSAKHAQATEVWLRIQLAHNNVCITIEDNGCGFSHQPTGPQGEGLANMRQRLQQIGGSFDYESQPGAGTVCRMTLPLISETIPPNSSDRTIPGLPQHRL
jgi:signal transduction histidine kinase